METFELKKEQLKLAPKITLSDGFDKVKTIAGIECAPFKDKLMACVVVCESPSMKVLEKQKYVLHNPIPYKSGYVAYREMPAIIEAYNQLEDEPDVIFVKGEGITHPRKIGLASHLGLALNRPTIAVNHKLIFGKIEKSKIILNNEFLGFEIITREHANPVYASPGHLVSLGSTLDLISKTIKHPHKMPEPLHLAHKILKKAVKKELGKEN